MVDMMIEIERNAGVGLKGTVHIDTTPPIALVIFSNRDGIVGRAADESSKLPAAFNMDHVVSSFIGEDLTEGTLRALLATLATYIKAEVREGRLFHRDGKWHL